MITSLFISLAVIIFIAILITIGVICFIYLLEELVNEFYDN